MIALTKDNTASPDLYSEGDNSDPVLVNFLLDGTGIPASVTATPATSLFIWANDDTGNIGSYTGIEVAISGADTGITWQLSLDGATGWASTLAINDLDVSVSHQAVQLYARATAINDGSVATNTYAAAKVRITAVENPA